MSQESVEVPFTYPEVGATRGEFPPGYDHFRLRLRIGSGRAVFEQAAEHIRNYGIQRDTGIFKWADTPRVEVGTQLTVRLALGPIGVDAPCRVVYVLDEEDRRGFAYGTLPGHPEIGEELFAVEYDPADDSVYGVIAAFSNPGAWYARLGGPIVRLLQRWFAHRYIGTLRPR